MADCFFCGTLSDLRQTDSVAEHYPTYGKLIQLRTIARLMADYSTSVADHCQVSGLWQTTSVADHCPVSGIRQTIIELRTIVQITADCFSCGTLFPFNLLFSAFM